MMESKKPDLIDEYFANKNADCGVAAEQWLESFKIAISAAHKNMMKRKRREARFARVKSFFGMRSE